MRHFFFILIIYIFQISNSFVFAQTKNSDSINYQIDISKSKIVWSCDLHDGYILLQDGSLLMEKNQIIQGDFNICMDSIIDLDIDYELMKITLENTLRSIDFFNTKEYPFANFKIDYVESTDSINTIFGDLTFLGVTKCVALPFSFSLRNDSIIVNSKEIIIDRASWGNTSMSKDDAKSDKSFIVPNEVKIKVILQGVKSLKTNVNK